MNRREFGAIGLTFGVAALAPNLLWAGDWQKVLDAAQGQTVWFHAWGGDPKINDFITWLGQQAETRHGVKIAHVKLAATADAVARVQAEQAAGVSEGAVDLIWINGENFAAMKDRALLFGPFAEGLPNWPLVDVAGKPATATDFTVPTLGFESPWAMAQLVFEHDSARVPQPPTSLAALKDWILAHPGRFTYPQPPDYLGLTFLKQVLYGVLPDPSILQHPAGAGADLAPLWTFLDAVHPALWRSARTFPANEVALGQLLADGETDISFSFNPGRASAEIAAGNLTDTVRTFVFSGGTIGNASFVAIPFNASHNAAAQVVANLILDPEVQAHAANPNVLGFQTVLDLRRLPAADRARFDDLPIGIATLPPDKLGPELLEPHATWMTRIAADWSARYGVAP
jgi:putative thiamine transport system substrate-binding protein